ncbi:hypothetical protein JR316_0005639 [Psilocybe cubensis]|uniref:Uncharacterized protein n=1 Tax=Psilocybe cubensis TaxID=181762 RepID=A0ACB8GZW1_PSICU|nr:hypothetical protein JR316_0005639 [Psilocybe cubensis]KAH9481119.1 hypothetical protein JR316_0005639 [Psilocybe cubensis]
MKHKVNVSRYGWCHSVTTQVTRGHTHKGLVTTNYHSKQYPTLSRIARDYLAIQGSSVAAERSFSAGGLTDVLNRNQMDPELFGYLQILKGCYKSQLMTAANEAKAHEPMDWESI